MALESGDPRTTGLRFSRVLVYCSRSYYVSILSYHRHFSYNDSFTNNPPHSEIHVHEVLHIAIDLLKVPFC
jgi:hypothetical protein